MDYEDIIEEIGGFGRWQILIFISICLPDIFFSMAFLIPVFVGAQPSWSCQDDNYRNITYSNNTDIQQNSTISILEKSLCKTCDIRTFDGEFTSIVSEWDLVCEKDYISDTISSIQMAGPLIGAAAYAQLSDSFGRKRSHFTAVLMLLISSTISAFAVNWQMFAAFRFLVGVSAGGYFCLNCVYPIEFVSRRWRTLCGTVGFWALGQSLLALFAYLIRDWRHLILITVVPVAGYVVFWAWVPESPRWLAQQGRIDEAKAVFKNIARRNKKPEPDLAGLDKVKNYLQTENNTDEVKKYTYLDLIKTKKMAMRTAIIMLLWFVPFLTFYEISFNVKNLSGNRYINQFIASVMDLSGLIFVVVFNNILGRRICMVVTTLGTIATNIALFVIYYMDQGDTSNNLVNGFALTGRSFALAQIFVIQIYSAELYPTDIRNVGVGAGSIAGRIGGIIGPILLYAGIHYQLLPYIVMGILSVFILPSFLFLPETNEEPLVDDFNLFTAEDHTKTEREINNEQDQLTKC